MALDTEPRDGFLERYEATVPAVFAYLMRACSGERTRAEDLTQETYSTAFRAWRAGQVDEITTAWLLTIARNKMIDGFRKADREGRKAEQAPVPTAADVASTVVDNDALLAQLRALPPMQRAVIALRFVDDLPIAEIARVLGKRRAAIDSLQRRALAALRTMLEEQDDEH